jgi:hypothetical protein
MTWIVSSARRRLGFEAIGQSVAGSRFGCPFGTSPTLVSDVSMLGMDTYSAKLVYYLLLFSALYKVSKRVVDNLLLPIANRSR